MNTQYTLIGIELQNGNHAPEIQHVRIMSQSITALTNEELEEMLLQDADYDKYDKKRIAYISHIINEKYFNTLVNNNLSNIISSAKEKTI